MTDIEFVFDYFFVVKNWKKKRNDDVIDFDSEKKNDDVIDFNLKKKRHEQFRLRKKNNCEKRNNDAKNDNDAKNNNNAKNDNDVKAFYEMNSNDF